MYRIALFFFFIALVACNSPGTRQELYFEADLESCSKTDNVELLTTSVNNELVFSVRGGANSAQLLNKCGEILNEWVFDKNLGNDVKLLSDGSLLGMFKADSLDFYFGGGYAGLTRIYDVKGRVQWEFRYANNQVLSHHEAIMLPNGNIMMMAWQKLDATQVKELGYANQQELFPEKIIEVDTATKEIIWEWRSWEHTIQSLDNTKKNYGEVSENLGKIDINYAPRKDGEIMHANGIFYDQNRDLIFMTINYYGEVWVIDHSTSMEEASSDKGGRYGVGGDLVYRFGNSKSYRTDEPTLDWNRVHCPSIIPKGYPGAGNFMIYNNGLKDKKSEVYELKLPDTLSLGPQYYKIPSLVWKFENQELFYGRISGAYRTVSGNTLICEGDYGFWEVTYDKEIAWKYKDKTSTFWRGYPVPLYSSFLKDLQSE